MSILVLTSDTLIGTPATGNLEYNGQFFGTDSNASRAQMQRITQGTAVASTSGTSIDFTGLPAWCKRITVMFSGVSTTGANNWLVQLGTSGGLQTSGYVGQGYYYNPGNNATALSAGFNIANQQAAQAHGGMLILTLVDTNKWVGMGMFSNPLSGASVSGYVNLSGTLDRVRITTTTAVDTFDAGSINILYEG